MEIDNIELTKEKETLFIPLYAKALDYQSKRPALNDKTAYDIINSSNYDFSKYKSGNKNILIIRPKHIDNWIYDFIKKYHNVTVLNIGCGMDARINRINPQSSVNWYDVDFPEVIALRKNYFPERDRYYTIGTSITEDNWYRKAPNNYPTIIVAEGVFEYLTEDEIKTLFKRLFDYFPKGEIIFDIISSFAANAGKKKLKETTGAEHKWAVDNTAEIDKYNRKLKRINDLSIFESPCVKNMNMEIKIFCKIASAINKYKNMLRLLRYEYS